MCNKSLLQQIELSYFTTAQFLSEPPSRPSTAPPGLPSRVSGRPEGNGCYIIEKHSGRPTVVELQQDSTRHPGPIVNMALLSTNVDSNSPQSPKGASRIYARALLLD